jgi:hypothetical protein
MTSSVGFASVRFPIGPILRKRNEARSITMIVGGGVYFEDLDGHLLEVITRPYGSGGWSP